MHDPCDVTKRTLYTYYFYGFIAHTFQEVFMPLHGLYNYSYRVYPRVLSAHTSDIISKHSSRNYFAARAISVRYLELLPTISKFCIDAPFRNIWNPLACKNTFLNTHLSKDALTMAQPRKTKLHLHENHCIRHRR